MAFNPEQYLSDLRGKKYLEVRYRILWFRDEHARGGINTEVVSIEGNMVLVRAVVTDENGVVLASGYGSATDAGNAVWKGRAVEKAETAAIGRALGHAGYGTQFALAGDDDEAGHLADSPAAPRKPTPPPPANAPGVEATPRKANGSPWTDKRAFDAWCAHLASTYAYSPSDVLKALKVERPSLYAGTLEQAEAAVHDWFQTK